MHYYNSMKELIGNTPLIKLNHLGVKTGVNLFAKLELYNPAGSVKDRTATYMINDAEKKGLLKKGGTIIIVLESFSFFPPAKSEAAASNATAEINNFFINPPIRKLL